jgi:cytochrome c peroxidase
MRNKIGKFGFLGFTALVICSFTVLKLHKTFLDYPAYWPAPAYDFVKNPVTEDGFELGRQLFYDGILSRDGTISCASCHLQATGFTHVDHDLSHGIDGRIGTRNSLALVNLAWNTSFMWDGGVNHLDMQALQPITSENEMDSSLKDVMSRLQSQPAYRKLFYKVFKDSTITGQRTLKALSQFTVSLVSSNSKYDKYIRNEKGGDFTTQEKNGLALYRNHCANCHTEPLFQVNEFKNNGIPIDPTLKDYGRYNVTKNKADSLHFKVPTLRNIEFTAPYMHDGRFENLRAVVAHYNGLETTNPLISKELLTPINLTPNEQTDLVVFLKTLSDYEFLYDPKFSFPKNLK